MFFVNLIVNPACLTALDILASRMVGKVKGGYSSAHYARGIGQDLVYVTGQWREPMTSLGYLIASAREEKERLEIEIDNRANRPVLAELWPGQRKRVLHRKLTD